jgi:hypothetical protein
MPWQVKSLGVKATSDSEWIYFGDGTNVKKTIVVEIINTHFIESRLLVSWTRQESFQVERDEIEKSIERILGLESFLIWDTNFKKVIEFNHIGVLRVGEVSS